jgi:hypothetical protein
MLTAQNIYAESRDRRKGLILQEVRNIEQGSSEIEKAREISRVLNTFLPEYFDLRISSDARQERGSVLSRENLSVAFDAEINRFKPTAINQLRSELPTREELLVSSKNLYEMAGAVKLSFANRATRNLSTTMGLLWERLASISPYAINTEIEFNIKVKGIDLIAKNMNTGVIEYQQLKTQHNTLTGSQKTRSVEELLLHDNPVFCACFANNSSWTFNHSEIARVSGEQFWSRIGIPYDLVLDKLRALILDLENEYISLL